MREKFHPPTISPDRLSNLRLRSLPVIDTGRGIGLGTSTYFKHLQYYRSLFLSLPEDIRSTGSATSQPVSLCVSVLS